jgi:hypothetical protein
MYYKENWFGKEERKKSKCNLYIKHFAFMQFLLQNLCLNNSGSNYVFSLTVMSVNCYILVCWAFPRVCAVFHARLCDFGRLFQERQFVCSVRLASVFMAP